MELLRSCACTQKQLESPRFQQWAASLKEPPARMHRKVWEWCYIAAALEERGMLAPGRRGLGFAVGEEPLTAAFAARGCTIMATDLDPQEAAGSGWVQTNQHAAGTTALNRRGICPPDEFRKRVSFRPVDMRSLPTDMGTYDFVWSSCSIEHLGSIATGLVFMEKMSRLLRIGGVAVHTTEYNVSSNHDTITEGQDVIFRSRDLALMKDRLELQGHTVEPFDFDTGDGPVDAIVDEPPYNHTPHLKLKLGGYVSTSFGVIVTAGRRRSLLQKIFKPLKAAA